MGPGLRTAPGLRRRAPAVGQGLGPRPRPPPRAPGLGAPAPSLGPAPRAPGLWSLGPRPRGPGSRLLTPSRQEARPLPAGSCGCGAVVAAPRLRAQPGPRRICIPTNLHTVLPAPYAVAGTNSLRAQTEAHAILYGKAIPYLLYFYSTGLHDISSRRYTGLTCFYFWAAGNGSKG